MQMHMRMRMPMTRPQHRRADLDSSGKLALAARTSARLGRIDGDPVGDGDRVGGIGDGDDDDVGIGAGVVVVAIASPRGRETVITTVGGRGSGRRGRSGGGGSSRRRGGGTRSSTSRNQLGAIHEGIALGVAEALLEVTRDARERDVDALGVGGAGGDAVRQTRGADGDELHVKVAAEVVRAAFDREGLAGGGVGVGLAVLGGAEGGRIRGAAAAAAAEAGAVVAAAAVGGRSGGGRGGRSGIDRGGALLGLGRQGGGRGRRSGVGRSRVGRGGVRGRGGVGGAIAAATDGRALIGRDAQGSGGHDGCRVQHADGVAAGQELAGGVDVLDVGRLQLTILLHDGARLEAAAAADVLVAVLALLAAGVGEQVGERAGGPAVEEVHVPAVAGGVALRERERVRLDLVDHLVQVELVLDEDVRQADRVAGGTGAEVDVAVRVGHVRARVVLVVVLPVPAVREVDGAVEARVGGAVVDVGREAAGGALVHALGRVADPLGDVLGLLVGVRSTREGTVSDHAEALGKLEGIALLVLFAAVVEVVHLVAIGRDADEAGAVLGLHVEGRVPVGAQVLGVHLAIGGADGGAAGRLQLLVGHVGRDVGRAEELVHVLADDAG